MKTLYLINHSHTDIGYTGVQELIMHYHVDFIDQAVSIIENELEKNNACSFVWTCENYWQIENYYANASRKQIAKLEQMIEAGYIDLSLNYLNMTELVEPSILNHYLKESQTYASKFSRRINSAMTADINGFSWGYCDSLVNHGVKNLFTCVHGHHGIYPLFKTQTPFWWQAQNGEKLLVWNGEHYHFGNETYIMPHAQTTYQIEDEFEGDLKTDQLIVAKERIFNYFSDLEKSGYKYSFAPLMVSGFISDNAGPNSDILEAINQWNSCYGKEITIKMIGLNDFFAVLNEEDLSSVPTYCGDWTDWWADGVGSTPAATKIYKNAIRKYRLLGEIDTKGILETSLAKQARDNLMLYAEHTWGYSSSVAEPWNTLVNELEYRKAAYSTNGSSIIGQIQLKEYIDRYAYAMPSANRPHLYRVCNPYNQPVTKETALYIDDWEHFDGSRIDASLMNHIQVVNIKTGQTVDSQTQKTARGFEVWVMISLKEKEETVLEIRLSQKTTKESQYLPFIKGAENVKDILFEGKVNDYYIDTQFLQVNLSNEKGIDSIIYKPTGQDLIDKKSFYSLFQGIYEKTEIVTDPCMERRRMGRNRKGRHVKRWVSRIININIIDRGPVFTSVQIDMQLEGTKMFSYILKIYQEIAKIDYTVRIQKTNEWAPENLYLALPISLDATRYFKKSGAVIRPAIDQLPGTNTDFYLLDTGIMYLDDNKLGMGICLKDTPLVVVGDLENHPIELFTEKMNYKNGAMLYSWIMNNFWETNFKVDLSGFYEFDYSIFLQENVSDINQLDMSLNIENEGLISLPINKNPYISE